MAQWLARYADIVEVAGSNPAVPTREYSENLFMNMELKVIYEDDNILAIEKPPGIVVFSAASEGEPRQRREKPQKEKTLINHLLKKFPPLRKAGKAPRYGIVHRLDKDTSGILLVAKNNKTLKFLQQEFKSRKPIKKYIILVVGNIKNNFGKIETLIGRGIKNRKKQKVFLPFEPKAKGKRKAITEYKILRRLSEYTLVEATLKTGRKHQIRCHFAHLGHPVAGDKMYGFKNQVLPHGLKRHFLHAFYLKIRLPEGQEKELKSPLPKDLKKVLEKINNDEGKN